MLEIDFFEDAIAYIDSKQQNPKPPEVTPEAPQLITLKDTHRVTKPELLTLEAEPEPEPDQKGYVINDEDSTITVQGTTYPIPTCFNKDMIRQRDKKTVDMVLIYLGYINLT